MGGRRGQLDGRTFAGFDDTFVALADYIDDFYNTERLHSANAISYFRVKPAQRG